MAKTRTEPTTNQAVLYARVSSEAQEEEGYSIDSQVTLLRGYAARHSLTVVREFVVAESAKASGRAGFGEMVDFLRQTPSCRTLLVEKTDRLTRNMSDLATVGELMQSGGVEIHLVKEGTVLSREARSGEKFMFNIKAAVAQHFIDNLREETAKGLAAKAAAGVFPGHAPFGYRNVSDSAGRRIIEVVPGMVGPVVKLFEAYSTGRHSIKQVAAMAREMGLAFRLSGKTPPKATIHKLLRNPVYYGAFEFNGKLYQGTHAPMVSRELWDRVQQQLSARPGKHRETKRTFAYGGGLMTCGACGCTIGASIKKGTYTYYHCSGFKGSHVVKAVREEVLTEQFAAALAALHFDDAEVLEWVTVALRESHVVEKREHDESVARLQAEHKKLEDRQHAMYEDKLDGRISVEFFDQKAAEWRAEQARLRGMIDRHQAANNQYLDFGARILELAHRGPELFTSSKPEDKRKLLGFVVQNCTLNDGKVSFEYRELLGMLAVSVKAADAVRGRQPLSGAKLAIWGG